MDGRLFSKCCVACLLTLASVSANGAEREEAYSEESLRAQIEFLDGEIRDLKQLLAEAQSTSGTHLTPELRTEIASRLAGLEAEVNWLQAELGYGNVAYVSDQALAGRGGVYLDRPPSTTAEPGLLGIREDLGEQSGIEISGFMDAVYSANVAQETPNQVYLNQVEVDFARALNDRASATLGVIYAEGFHIGTAVIAFDIKPEAEEQRAFLRSWSASAGQFDVPFGEDVNYYPSNVRQSISVPELTTATHNLWNHLGAMTTLNFGRPTLDCWIVDGCDLQSNLLTDDPTDELNFSGGGRLNYTLADGLRIGASGALGWLPDGSAALQLYGTHAAFEPGSWQFIAEGVALHEAVSGKTLARDGYYVQALKRFGTFFSLVRADYVEGSSFETLRYYNCGCGIEIGHGLEARGEFRLNGTGSNRLGLLQVVATF